MAEGTSKKTEDKLSEIDSMGESMFYFLVDSIDGFSWRMRHDHAHGRISDEDMKGIEKDLERLHGEQVRAIRNLTRFGIAKPLTDDDEPTYEYRAWYKWWNHWHHNDLTNEQWDELNHKISAKEDISSYRPSGDWRDALKRKVEERP